MKIGQAAAQSGLPAKTLRYYDAIGLIRPSERSETGYRLYNDQDVHLLRFVQRARSLGFTVEECRDLLDLYRDRRRTSADVQALAQARIVDIGRRLGQLRAIRESLEQLVARCQSDDRPECPILDDLAGAH